MRQFKAWKDILPIETIDRLLRVLFPQIEKLCVDKCVRGVVRCRCLTHVSRGVTYETEVLAFLKQGTLVGLLPVPHAILVRKYQHGATLNSLGFITFFWSIVYLKFATCMC